MNEKLNKIAEAMYNLNRHISWNYIALKKVPDEKFISDINRMLGEWIKQIREIAEGED